jgi:hypothetical protein
VPASTLGDVSSRFVGGSVLALHNYTSRSLYGQSPSRPVIGSRLSVRVRTTALDVVVSGRVIRASLTRVVDGVPHYEVALALDAPVDWGGDAVPVDGVAAAAVPLEPVPVDAAVPTTP